MILTLSLGEMKLDSEFITTEDCYPNPVGLEVQMNSPVKYNAIIVVFWRLIIVKLFQLSGKKSINDAPANTDEVFQTDLVGESVGSGILAAYNLRL